ncbi:MAG: pyridoxamine 5'-phosphate oxidase family protein [Vicinamibacterales bacterium]
MTTRKRVFELLDAFDTAMLVTTADDGLLEARPMELADVEADGPIWLLTSRHSRKVAEVQESPEVLLVCQDGTRRAISVRGRARLVSDPARIRRLWSETERPWYPGGPDDPDLALLAIDPVSAEFWDRSGARRASFLWDAARAYAAGERLDDAPDGDRHGRGRL